MQGFYRVGRAGQGRAGVRRHGVINFYCHLVLVQQNLSILHSSDRALTNIYRTEGKRKLEYNIFSENYLTLSIAEQILRYELQKN